MQELSTGDAADAGQTGSDANRDAAEDKRQVALITCDDEEDECRSAAAVEDEGSGMQVEMKSRNSAERSLERRGQHPDDEEEREDGVEEEEGVLKKCTAASSPSLHLRSGSSSSQVNFFINPTRTDHNQRSLDSRSFSPVPPPPVPAPGSLPIHSFQLTYDGIRCSEFDARHQHQQQSHVGDVYPNHAVISYDRTLPPPPSIISHPSAPQGSKANPYLGSLSAAAAAAAAAAAGTSSHLYPHAPLLADVCETMSRMRSTLVSSGHFDL